MPEEIEGILLLMQDVRSERIGYRTYHQGYLDEVPVVAVFSRWGKVAASATTATLIHRYQISELVFTGVAGAIHPNLNVGDVVMATQLMQHDLDARPLMQQFEVPLLSKTYFETDIKATQLFNNLFLSWQAQHRTNPSPAFKAFNIENPKLHVGLVASGDQFIADQDKCNWLRNSIPNLLCVEMEGAAVAQVCFENQIPLSVIRTISDTADHKAAIDFPRFVKEIAGQYAAQLIPSFVQKLTRLRKDV